MSTADFFNKVKAEQKAREAEIKGQSKLEEDAIKAAQKAFRDVMDKAKKQTEAKPKIIRHGAEG